MTKLSALALLALPVFAQTADVRGSQDHPLLSRYPGSIIQAYQLRDFDQYPLALGVENNRPARTQAIEGRITKITYVHPKGRAPFEIYKNYEDALKKAGFQPLWTCAAAACGLTMHWNTLNGLAVSGSAQDLRYLTVRGSVENRVVTVAMAVGSTQTAIHIVEAKPMDAGLVTASAAEIADGLDRDGHIPVYAIYFDTGKTAVKPESRPALEEIAKLLKSRPALRLMVVGHTDSTGALDMNMTLSAGRAASVVAALTGEHGVAAGRLSGHGAGPLAPVATNRTDAGKARNRRVELVEQ